METLWSRFSIVVVLAKSAEIWTAFKEVMRGFRKETLQITQKEYAENTKKRMELVK